MCHRLEDFHRILQIKTYFTDLLGLLRTVDEFQIFVKNQQPESSVQSLPREIRQHSTYDNASSRYYEI